MNFTLLKLGGSLITDKSKPYTLREKFIKNVSEEIFRAKKEDPSLNIILGNGAGSFAHQSAKKFNTIDGVTNDVDRFGASLVHYDAQRLNQILLENFLQLKMPILPVHPSSFMHAIDKKVDSIDDFMFVKLIELGYMPITYGDVIIDLKIGATILSTDLLFKKLAERLNFNGHKVSIIHAGDYDGVLDKKNQAIKEINAENLASITSLKSTQNVDVTGGMKKKVEEMVSIAKLGITSQIINGTVAGNIYKTLQGENLGTKIC
jgi:isopentenyl phosphate kinase